MNSVHFSSWSVHWCSPFAFLRVLNAFSKPYLDPASNPGSIVNAVVNWDGSSSSSDGLRLDWFACSPPSKGIVYVNPPYHRDLSRLWSEKIQWEAGKGCEIVALVAARCETEWWNELNPQIWCAWKGRIHFVRWFAPGVLPTKDSDEDPGAAFPSAVLYWGNRVEKFKSVFGAYGKLYVPVEG